MQYYNVMFLDVPQPVQIAGSARGLEAVVVSGMSGRFPESANVEEFAHNLYNGVDMVSENDHRWTPGKQVIGVRIYTLR